MLRKQNELADERQTTLQGWRKRTKAAALAALLVALAAALATTAVASSQCLECPPPTPPPPCGFVTSGGFVYNDAGQEVNFGAHGGCKTANLATSTSRSLTGLHLNALEVTGFFNPTADPNVRGICGSATTNTADPQPVYFHIRLTDNGEPGVADLFGIRLSNGYVLTPRLPAAGRKGGGDVQLHEPNPSTASPNPMPDEGTMCNGVPEP